MFDITRCKECEEYFQDSDIVCICCKCHEECCGCFIKSLVELEEISRRETGYV